MFYCILVRQFCVSEHVAIFCGPLAQQIQGLVVYCKEYAIIRIAMKSVPCNGVVSILIFSLNLQIIWLDERGPKGPTDCLSILQGEFMVRLIKGRFSLAAHMDPH